MCIIAMGRKKIMAERALDLYKHLKSIQRNLRYGSIDQDVESVPGDKDGQKRAKLIARKQRQMLTQEALQIGE